MTDRAVSELISAPMPTLSLLLLLSPALFGGDAVATPGSERLLPLNETLEAQGAPSMMDLNPQSYGQPKPVGPARWYTGQTLMQGYFGALLLETVETSGGNVPPVDGSNDDLAQMPTIGGGAMYKMGGNAIDWGFEGMLAFAGRANASAFYFGGGGAAIAINVDLLIFDLYGGLFVSKFLGDKLRIYGAAGPLMEWANYDQNATNVNDSGNGNGFGFGGYARAGAELVISRGTMVGLAGRWSDATIDLSGGMGDLDLSGTQVVLTVTTGL